MRFLIADDNAPFRRMVREVLREGFGPGLELLECSNGKEAVDTYAAEHPDWVIMDLEMPLMDGLEATRHILGSHPSARVLVLTLHVGEEYRTAAEEAGAAGFLEKERIADLCGRLGV
jgi:DNA-binding NarL/FixJ family response regulator